VGLVGFGALFIVGLNRLTLALMPMLFVVPLAGYLTVLRPESGSSVVFDLVALLPVAVVVARALVPGSSTELFRGPQALVWVFIVVALTAFATPGGTRLLIGTHGLRQLVVPMLLRFVGYQLVADDRRLRRLAWIFVFSGVIPALWALKQHVIGLTGAELSYARKIGTFWAGDEIRVFSTFQAPWVLAAYMGGVAVVGFALALSARTLLGKLIALDLSMLATSALVFTHVRGCLMGYAAGVLFLLVTLLGRRIGMRRAVLLFLLLLGGYAVFAVVVGPAIVDSVPAESIAARRVLTLLAPARELAMQARLVAWQDLAETVLESPFGTGLGSTGGVSKRFAAELPRGSVQPDNVYLAVPLETGWAGGLVYVALVVHVLVVSLRACRPASARANDWLRRGGVAYLLMMAIANIASPITFGPGASHFYWLISGIMARQGLVTARTRVLAGAPAAR
jgi:hypothetical protein